MGYVSPQIDPEPGASGTELPPGRPMLFERADEVFAGTWIGFSEDDARSIAEGANISNRAAAYLSMR